MCKRGKVSPEGVNDINRDRSCKDVLCLIVFAVCCAAGLAVGFMAISQGNPESLVYGSDAYGNVCGSKNSNTKAVCPADQQCYTAHSTRQEGGRFVKIISASDTDRNMAFDYSGGRTKTIYPRLVQDIADAISSGGTANFDPTQVNYYGVCVDACPTGKHWVCSPYGLGFLKDTFGHAASGDSLPTKVDETYWPDAWNFLEGCQGRGSFNSASSDCTQIAEHCFYSPIPTKETFMRCFPNYNQTLEYACDTDQNGVASRGTESTTDMQCIPGDANQDECWKPMPANNVPFAAEDASDCETMLVRSTSQQAAQKNFIYDQMSGYLALFGRMIGDLSTAQVPILVCGMALTTVLGFVWLALLRRFARCFIWTILLGVVVMQLVLVIFFFSKAGLVNVDTSSASSVSGGLVSSEDFEASNSDTDVWKWSGIVMAVLLVLQLLMCAAMSRKINIAASIVGEASKAVADNKFIVVFPLLPMLLVVVLFSWFMWVAAALYSVGPIPVADNNSTQISTADWGQWMMLYHVFMLLWGNNFLEGFAIVTVAGTVCGWYFTPEDKYGNRQQKDKFAVASSMWRTIRYHLGSVAIGSFLIAVVQMARLILEYVDRQTKEAQDKSRLIRILMKCLKCCLACFEKCVKYLTVNAYIYVAYGGHSFFGAAKQVFFLIKENMAQMGVVSAISSYLLILGKVLLVSIASIICYLWLEYDATYKNVTTMFTPILVEALLSYVIASVFLEVYSVAIDTILVCYCEDVSKNDGTDAKPYYASKNVLKMAKKYKSGSTKRARAGSDDEDASDYDDEDDDSDKDEGEASASFT